MSDQSNGTAEQPAPPADTVPMETAMETGQGADDEPELSIGDRHAGEAPPDPDGDGKLTVAEAEKLLGGGGGT